MKIIPSWISFLIALAVIMILSKWDLGISMIIGSVLLALLAFVDLFGITIKVILNPVNLFLALSMVLIPILGGIMEESGLIIDLINNMDIPKKTSLMLSPAIFGLLPVPGGALMSAPLVDQIDPELDKNQKVGINVWYRHTLLLIYPVTSSKLIVSTMAGLSLYDVVAALFLPAVLMFLIGYFTLVRNVGKKQDQQPRNLRIVLRNLLPIILTVIIDYIGRFLIYPLFPVIIPEVYLFAGLCLSILLSLKLSRNNISVIKPIAKKMKVWRYPLLIYAMVLFFEVFSNSGVPQIIGTWELNFFLFLLIAFSLGFATGSVQLANSILIPIYLIQYGLTVMPIISLSLIYFSVFMGYLITPIHPCIAYSVEFFKTEYRKSFRYLAAPVFICFAVILIVTIFVM
ncbi:MAG: DUF401 family protein [Promethearchaeota archaeon]